MRAARAVAILLSTLAFTAFAVSGFAMWAALEGGGRVGAYLLIAFIVVAVGTAAAFAVLRGRLLQPIDMLAGELALHAQTRIDRTPTVDRDHWLDELPAAVAKLLCALRAARGEIDNAVSAATQRAEEQKSSFEAILLDLSEGVIVCNLNHRILLYNQAAARILDMRTRSDSIVRCSGC